MSRELAAQQHPSTRRERKSSARCSTRSQPAASRFEFLADESSAFGHFVSAGHTDGLLCISAELALVSQFAHEHLLSAADRSDSGCDCSPSNVGASEDPWSHCR